MARTSSKSSVIEKDGKVARLLERSFLLARNTALSHLSQHIPVIWIPEAEDTANRETIRRFDDRFQNETTAQRVKLLWTIVDQSPASLITIKNTRIAIL